MRKILLSLIYGVLILELVTGCGGNNTTTGENDSGTSNTQNNNSGKNYEIADELKGNIGINLTTAKYCISSPKIASKRANTGRIVESESYFVIYDQYVDISSDESFGVNLNTIKSAEDVIEAMKEQISATSRNGLIFADEYTIEISNSENVKVNSWDMCKTTGKIKLSCEFPLDYDSVNFVSYSVIKDGFPIYFAVVENPIGETPIDLGAMADKIAKSFRDNDGDCYDD